MGNKPSNLTFLSKPSKMKTTVPFFKGILCLLILLNSCSSSKNFIEQHKPEIESAKEGSACFVQMSDGSIKHYSSLKLVTGVFQTPHLIADDSITITSVEIKAYQNNEHYAISQKEFTALKNSYVAVKALPGFAVRVAKGKLNIYSLKFYNGHNTTEKFFLQAGTGGEIAVYTPELMNELVRDNIEAFNFFNDKTKPIAVNKKLMATADIYNNSRFITKN